MAERVFLLRGRDAIEHLENAYFAIRDAKRFNASTGPLRRLEAIEFERELVEVNAGDWSNVTSRVRTVRKHEAKAGFGAGFGTAGPIEHRPGECHVCETRRALAELEARAQGVIDLVEYDATRGFARAMESLHRLRGDR